MHLMRILQHQLPTIAVAFHGFTNYQTEQIGAVKITNL